MFELTGPLLNRWLAPFYTGVDNALALYLKTNQLFSYQRLQGVFRDLFGLDISQGALMNMFKRTAPIFAAKREDALVALRRADIVACDETGMRIEGCNGYQWVFCAPKAVVHTQVEQWCENGCGTLLHK